MKKWKNLAFVNQFGHVLRKYIRVLVRRVYKIKDGPIARSERRLRKTTYQIIKKTSMARNYVVNSTR